MEAVEETAEEKDTSDRNADSVANKHTKGTKVERGSHIMRTNKAKNIKHVLKIVKEEN